MNIRPKFEEIKSYEEFKKYYWYRDELSNICKQLNINYTGTKQELNNNIKEYFNGNLIRKKKISKAKSIIKEINLDSPLLYCGFSFNKNFREFFSKQTGISNFKFTADMATAWRKVKEENNTEFTLQNMLDIYYNNNSNYAKYDNSTCEWNKFLKDFCEDKRNEKYKNKLKTAAILWKIVKESKLEKIYSYDLVQKYENLLGNSQKNNIIGLLVKVVVDRPIGSSHPIYKDLKYTINYGYIEGIMAPDGEEQDAYIIGVDTPLEFFIGKVVGIIHRENDIEEKWVVAPENREFSYGDIKKAVDFQEKYFKYKIIM